MKFVYANADRPLDGYTIKRGIGVGGFGEVYFALSDAGKEVALKRIQRNLDVELRGVRQCLNLKHANLIDLFDIKYDAQGQPWVVMEYVPGESLKEVLQRNPNGLPEDQLQAWFQGMAAGVAYLHDHGIVHRDLKPGNVFADEDAVKLGDYGLSKFISCSRRSGQTESVGTFHYMAPEIGKGDYGKQIDIYSLGILLYEMLTGRVPFDGESSQEIMMKHLTAEPDLSGIGPPYREVIARALRKDPQQRFGSVQQMLDVLQGAPSPARPAHSVPPSSSAVPPIVITDQAEPLTERERQAEVEGEVEAEVVPEVLYIGDEPQPQVEPEMTFGPLREVVTAEAVPARAPATGQAMRQQQGRMGGPAAARQQGPAGGWAEWWSGSGMNAPLKILLLLGGLVLLIVQPYVALALAVVLGVIYLGTRAIAWIASPGNSDETAEQTGEQPVRGGRSRSPRRYRRWQEQARQNLWQRPLGERLAEWSGSLLLSAAVAAVLCLVMMLLAGTWFDGTVYVWSFYTWLTLTSIAGAWTVLTLGKFWEGSLGDPIRRRFLLLVAGLALGAASYGTEQVLMVDVRNEMSLEALGFGLAGEQLFAADGSARLPAYLLYFGGLLLVPRWWRQVDPLRSSRLSLWATSGCVLWAWVLYLFWQFPQPWGLMLAAVISMAVQFSAPWMDARQRAAVRQQLQQA